ncbi:MAG: PAS domain S-box protein [Candidatus Aminicenantes bacterium]|nr:PAS domain S-box protein [Candidatus Aminicenantes bacterium]
MLWKWSFGVIAEVIASASILVLAIYFPWRELNRRARLFGSTLLLACALWMLSHAIEIGLPVAAVKSYLMGAQLFWGTVAITFWWLYIIHHSGSKKWLTVRVYRLLGLMPGILIVGIWTNPLHHLIWGRPGLDGVNPYLPLQPAYGIVYWIGMAYVFALTLSGSLLLIKKVIHRQHGRTRESVGLLMAVALPMLAALVETLGLSSSLKLSIGLTPWASFVGGLLLIWNLPRFQLHKVIPLAHDTVFERINDSILVLDKWDRILDLNPAAEQLLGCKISVVRGLSVKQILPQWPDQIDLADPTLVSNREIILERGGETGTYNLSVSLVPDRDGHPTSRLVLLTDASSRKKIEDVLRESEKEFHSLAESMPQIVWITRPDGWNIYFNQQWVDYTGQTLEESYGHGWNKPFHPDDRQRAWEAWQNATNFGALYSLECRLRRADGAYRWWLIRGTPNLDAAGKIIKWFGTCTDIDSMKQAEESIRASLREKEVLLREVHHRVKNNMQVISSLFNLQAGHTLNEDGRAILKEAQARIRAISLVHEKLYQSADLSRIDLGGYLNSLAIHLVHFYRPQPGLVRLETDLEEATLGITSAIPCGLLLNELISNALKHAFAQNRAGVIRIGLKHGPGDLIVIRVADDGIGFPEDLDFRKSDSLGLQIVNLLAGQLNATIELDRTNGTAFTLTFREVESASPA